MQGPGFLVGSPPIQKKMMVSPTSFSVVFVLFFFLCFFPLPFFLRSRLGLNTDALSIIARCGLPASDVPPGMVRSVPVFAPLFLWQGLTERHSEAWSFPVNKC